METYTIAEAAQATTLNKKAIRNRVDRGQMRPILRDGVRGVPRSELERAGLSGSASEAVREVDEGEEPGPRQFTDPGATPEALDRLERQAGELAELRLLTREADSLRGERDRIEAALHESRARASELEAKLTVERQAGDERVRRLVGAGWREQRLMRELRAQEANPREAR